MKIDFNHMYDFFVITCPLYTGFVFAFAHMFVHCLFPKIYVTLSFLV